MRDSNRKGKTWVKYVSGAIIGLVIALVVCLVQDLFNKTDIADIFRVLSNAFFIPSIVLTCFGLLTLSNVAGTFDMIDYGFKSFKRARRNSGTNVNIPKTFYDYKEQVKGKRKVSWHLIIVGLVYLAVAIVFTILFGKV